MPETCPIVGGLLENLRHACTERSELRDLLSALEPIEERVRSEPDRFRTQDERRQRVALCVVAAMKTATTRVTALGLDLPQLPAAPLSLPQICDVLLEQCELEAIERSMSGGKHRRARRIDEKELERTKTSLKACRDLVVSASEYLVLPDEHPSDKAHARTCGVLLANLFSVAELPFEQRIQFAGWVLAKAR